MEFTLVVALSSIFFNGLIGLMWWSVKNKITGTNLNFSKLFKSIENLNNSLTALNKDIGSIQSKNEDLENRINNQDKIILKHLEQITELRTKMLG